MLAERIEEGVAERDRDEGMERLADVGRPRDPHECRGRHEQPPMPPAVISRPMGRRTNASSSAGVCRWVAVDALVLEGERGSRATRPGRRSPRAPLRNHESDRTCATLPKRRSCGRAYRATRAESEAGAGGSGLVERQATRRSAGECPGMQRESGPPVAGSAAGTAQDDSDRRHPPWGGRGSIPGGRPPEAPGYILSSLHISSSATFSSLLPLTYIKSTEPFADIQARRTARLRAVERLTLRRMMC